MTKDYNRGRKEALKEVIELIDNTTNLLDLKLILLDKIVEVEKGGLFGVKDEICLRCKKTLKAPRLKVIGILTFAHCGPCDHWTPIKVS